MGKQILYALAANGVGDFVLADAAQRGHAYFCPSCRNEMVFRMGAQVRPHFAHKNLTHNCSPETVLHFAFKRLLFERISASLFAGERLSLQWECDSCSGTHSGNLLKRASHVQEEFSLGACRPDIALLDGKGNVVAAIEIVVTHPPEPSTIEYYKKKSIPLIVFELKSDAELSRASEDVLRPDIVDACLNPKCPRCNRHMPRMKLLIIDGECWRCKAPMKVGALKGDAELEGEFDAFQIALANQHGANIRTRYSRTVRDRYAANTCTRCNAFIGNHYLFADYVAMLGYSRIELDAGYYCPVCCNGFRDHLGRLWKTQAICGTMAA